MDIQKLEQGVEGVAAHAAASPAGVCQLWGRASSNTPPHPTTLLSMHTYKEQALSHCSTLLSPFTLLLKKQPYTNIPPCL